MGFTLLYTCQRGPKNSRKIGFKTHLLPKQIVRRKNKLNNFGSLIWQGGHVPCVFNYVRTFWICPAQKINLSLGRSSDIDTYIVCAFESFISLTFWPPDGQLSLSHARTASDISPRAISDTQPEMGARKNTLHWAWISKSPHHTDTHV